MDRPRSHRRSRSYSGQEDPPGSDPPWHALLSASLFAPKPQLFTTPSQSPRAASASTLQPPRSPGSALRAVLSSPDLLLQSGSAARGPTTSGVGTRADGKSTAFSFHDGSTFSLASRLATAAAATAANLRSLSGGSVGGSGSGLGLGLGERRGRSDTGVHLGVGSADRPGGHSTPGSQPAPLPPALLPLPPPPPGPHSPPHSIPPANHRVSIANPATTPSTHLDPTRGATAEP